MSDNANSRIRVCNTPELYPGCCAVCGASKTDDRQYVDVGLTLDGYGTGYGTVYFCTFCMVEIANVMGYVKDNSIKSELEATKAALKVANDTIKVYSEFHNAIRDLGPSTATSSLLSPSSDVVEDDSTHSDGNGEEGSSNSEADIPLRSEGHSSVRSNAERGNSGILHGGGGVSVDISIDELLA